MPGTYLINLYAGTLREPEDEISNAANLTVLERDIYDSGIFPKPGFNGLNIPE